MKRKLMKGVLKIIFSPLLLILGVLTSIVLLPLYPFLRGWVIGDGNPSPSFLRFLWAILTMYIRD